MNLLKNYRFKQDIVRLFEKHHAELVIDNGLEVVALQHADAKVFSIAYDYCCANNLHLSIIHKIKSFFKQWVEDRDLDRTMRIW